MAFEAIPPIPKAEDMFERILKQQKRVYGQNKVKSTSLDFIKREKEATKVGIISVCDALVDQADYLVEAFPHIDHLTPVYRHLIPLMIDVDKWRRNLGALLWLKVRVRSLQSQYTKDLTQSGSIEECKKAIKSFLGRTKSVIKQIDPQLQELEKQRLELRKLPTIREKYRTVVIYGFPNVGKSTLLAVLTSAKPEIAPYPFTTKEINLGYTKDTSQVIQMIDTPGSLARKEKQNKYEQIAEVVVAYAAEAIVYVADPTESTSVAEQARLFKRVPKEIPHMTYLSKKDLVSAETYNEWKRKFAPAGDSDDVRAFLQKLPKKEELVENQEFADEEIPNDEEIEEYEDEEPQRTRRKKRQRGY